jgi:carbon-monoxide dehydrogenase catalytic subunit
MAKKGKTPEEFSIDPAAIEILSWADQAGVSTAFSRADAMRPCPIGADNMCCKVCYMGPCRLVKDGQTGVCGATIDTVVARNLARAIAAGAAAHSDHGRDLAHTLKLVAEGKAPDYVIRDPGKLMNMAEYLGISVDGKPILQLAGEVADMALAQFGQPSGVLALLKRAPRKRQEIWHEQGVEPRNVDREVVEVFHRTHIGNDQDAEHILEGAVRCALSDGWGGSMLGTDLSDVLFGTPGPLVAQANLGVLSKDQVNIVIHGHEPTLSEMIVAAALDPEMQAYAKSKGAEGINLSGICCTSNETLMRQGVPSAGNFLHQELAILTGAVDAMVVDVQCIMQALVPLMDKFHTAVVTTSRKAKITGSIHMKFEEERAMEVAKEIIKLACDRFPERGEVRIPDAKSDVVPGFSHEYIGYALGGTYRGSFRPLNDAIMAGRIRGVVANIGCNNPRVQQDYFHDYVVKEFLKNDVLVVETGCGAIASGKAGFMMGEAALEYAGPGLREVCEAVGMPPVLHMGSCVDNSRILTVLSQMATEGGLGEDISDIPAVGMAPEWMSEKALSIAAYCVASGAYVIMGTTNPVKGSQVVQDLINEGWREKYGGRLEFIIDAEEIVKAALDHIDERRAALKLPAYDPTKWGESGDARMNELLEMPIDERIGALYGEPV